MGVAGQANYCAFKGALLAFSRILLKRLGKPAEVAAAVTSLASDDASYIMGQTIVVDGGLTAAAA